jgi:hypothetical protein
MKTNRYSAVAAFFGRGKRSPAANAEARLADLSKETGVPVDTLSLFSKIGGHKGFTAEAAHKDFGHLKRKQVA